jgi:hypothetical protein
MSDRRQEPYEKPSVEEIATGEPVATAPLTVPSDS